MKEQVQEIVDKWGEVEGFSGVISVSGDDGVIYQKAFGYRNKAEELPNTVDTAFAIASGTKLFTALAACKLIDEGKLALSDKIWNVLPYDLKEVDKDVTVEHLLTHTSGVGDYIDEEADSEYFDILKLYENHPSFKWTSLESYLPMIVDLRPKFKPGERVGYSNAGFILLGLIIESVSKMSYHEYIKENIIQPLNLNHTGFYPLNNLPKNSALGYISDDDGDGDPGTTTNILFMPIIGGSDGGIFTCADDLDTLWKAIMSDRIFSAKMRELFFTPHEDFGLGVYLDENEGKKVYFTVGGDYGVDFVSAYFPSTRIIVSALGNTEINTFPLMEKLFEVVS